MERASLYAGPSRLAVVGFAFRFPGPAGEGFWRALREGRDLLGRVPESRWPVETFYHPRRSEPGSTYTRASGSIGDIDGFDAAFFGMSPREAAQLDPQQRLLLELTWEAFEAGGIRPSSVRGARASVTIGFSGSDLSHRVAGELGAVDGFSMTGVAGSIAANRLSYFFDLRGPSMALDTACSSSLFAFHQACQSILHGESDFAIAGAVSLHVHPFPYIGFSKAGMLSRRGVCAPFDAQADGYVRSEGAAIMLLKRLDEARAAGDRIFAVVAGSAVNSDGKTNGLTVPSCEAQTALRRFADLAGSLSTPEGHRVRGLALNRWADLVPSPLSERARAEAVRELLEGGDRAAARKVLEGLATDRTVPGEAHAVAQAALLEVLIADGQLDVVEQRLSNGAGSLTADDRAELRLALAKARIARGELDRADAALGDDSSVAAIAQRGWIDLYRGDLKGAMDAFRTAGPYATDRAAATERTAMMAMLQRIQVASSPELGAALLTLARGDTATAITALRRAASKLPVEGGRLEVLLLAGQAAARAGGEHETTAIALFDEILRGDRSESAALPAAELEWSRLLMRGGRALEAIPHLEHLILTYPNSAFVPEARRVLERARGVIPKS